MDDFEKLPSFSNAGVSFSKRSQNNNNNNLSAQRINNRQQQPR